MHSCLELGMFLSRSYFFHIIKKTINKSVPKIMMRVTMSAATVINRVSNFLSAQKKKVEKIADFGHK